ncbi:Leucine zipper transcription factor-like protein 1 [Tetrabaena socialis]|uniref:Leucine zipper transcription factor-like protein 1 n=1 Tax=Tetrabaena socialis TaxID=47790 RepID=A0A2J8A4N3_9CHLO|nr:Leucine zipper transcription factor-like protein 1 [Tetrabaena socialis]|eukprot:PNH07479.1 Leucine zipper transcription factor-like protein 1 [Tetrabaena socialis]
MSKNTLVISEDGELQVQAYLRFAKLKREQHVREVVSTISDFKADRIRQGEMYNFKELAQMFDDLEQETRQLMDKEIQNAYHANALLVKILLSQAQVHGAELMVDTNSLENEFLLKQISSSETTALSRPASDFVRRNTQLGRMGTVATVSTQDPALIKERDALKAELASTKERMAKLQAARNQLALKDKELRAASEALNGKLQESKQFLQMKQMMQSKSTEVTALRKKLEKYEPQSVPSADTA